jgi:hypothetical protein
MIKRKFGDAQFPLPPPERLAIHAHNEVKFYWKWEITLSKAD